MAIFGEMTGVTLGHFFLGKALNCCCSISSYLECLGKQLFASFWKPGGHANPGFALITWLMEMDATGSVVGTAIEAVAATLYSKRCIKMCFGVNKMFCSRRKTRNHGYHHRSVAELPGDGSVQWGGARRKEFLLLSRISAEQGFTRVFSPESAGQHLCP